jgi:hypothetical protein
MHRLASAKARATTPRFEPSAAPGAAAVPTGRPLAGSGNARADAALTMLCRLQVSAPAAR